MAKRLFDLLVAFAGLLVLFPLVVFLSIAIALKDGTPVFFKQQRVGKGGKSFKIIKFRTMHVLDSAESGQFDPGDSSRVTTIGGFLRRTKLDELPQLLNVIKGEMSIVGPRPEVDKWVQEYSKQWEKIHTVKPGITDPASIIYKNEEQLLSKADDPEQYYRAIVLPGKLKIYEEYVHSWSMANDIKIMFRTAYAVLIERD